MYSIYGKYIKHQKPCKKSKNLDNRYFTIMHKFIEIWKNPFLKRILGDGNEGHGQR
jgi:hypothetical protein